LKLQEILHAEAALALDILHKDNKHAHHQYDQKDRKITQESSDASTTRAMGKPV